MIVKLPAEILALGCDALLSGGGERLWIGVGFFGGVGYFSGG